MKKTFLALACLCTIGAAHAQAAGSWLIQGGLTRIAPDAVSYTHLTLPTICSV